MKRYEKKERNERTERKILTPAGQKELAKRYIIQIADRMIELTMNSQETLMNASSQSLHFDNEAVAYFACLCSNMFISQLTLYDENQE
jgi:hypothetical protein